MRRNRLGNRSSLGKNNPWKYLLRVSLHFELTVWCPFRNETSASIIKRKSLSNFASVLESKSYKQLFNYSEPRKDTNAHCSKGGAKVKIDVFKFWLDITLEKVQNWSLYSVKSVFWKDTFLSFTSKIWSELRKSIILVFM